MPPQGKIGLESQNFSVSVYFFGQYLSTPPLKIDWIFSGGANYHHNQGCPTVALLRPGSGKHSGVEHSHHPADGGARLGARNVDKGGSHF